MEVKIEPPEKLKENTNTRRSKMQREFRKEPVIKVFKNTENYNQMIAQINIPFSALCEHHIVSFTGHANVAYIPKDYLVGLSKIARVVEFFLNPTRRTIQEKATNDILVYLQEKLDAKGIMVVLKAEHSCILYRGVKKSSLTITSAIHGLFATDASTKAEFLQLVNGK